MKKLFVILLYSVSYEYNIAQDTVKTFASYQFTIPGSSFQSRMVPVPGGSFLMGSPNAEKSREADEGPQQTVTIAPFWMGANEVTRDEFDVFYKDEGTSAISSVDAVTRPSPQYIDFSLGMGKEGGFPVNSLSQYSALMYCRWLYSKTGVFYRLPTEAEWEYACRAGSKTAYFFGDDVQQLGKYAWYKDNSDNKFHKTGSKSPNAWGLYDMLGNVCEWTLDHYDEKTLQGMAGKTDNPSVIPNPLKYPKVLRGGGYSDDAVLLRSANRFKSDPVWNRRDPQIPKSKWWLTDAPTVGFRIIRPVEQPAADKVNEFFKAYLGN